MSAKVLSHPGHLNLGVFNRKQLDILSCLRTFHLSSERLLQFWGSVRETQVFNPETRTWLKAHGLGGVEILWLCIMWVFKVIWAQVGITRDCLPLSPGFMWHLGITWPQVCMMVKQPEGVLPREHCWSQTTGVLVHHLCLEKVSPSGHRWPLLLLFQTTCLCPEQGCWSHQRSDPSP